MENITEVKSLSRILFNRFFEDWRKLSPEELFSFLSVKIEQAITFDELKDLLNSGEKIKIKFGIDPTGPEIHLGHLLPIILLRQFQKAGHEINLIIGDFTALIGDPSGRSSQRPPLTEKEVKNNFKTYRKQIDKYLDTRNVKIHKNSKWLSKIDLKKIISDLSKMSLSEILQRNDFRERIEKGSPLAASEILYSYAQGMDSVELKPDIEVGGRDQLLNFSHARKLMQSYNIKPEIALVTPVLEGISGDGRKMSKSYDNYISVNADLEDKFGKIMSIPDNLMLDYYKAFTDIKEKEIDTIKELIEKNPMETKKQLAEFIVSIESKNLDIGAEEREKFEGKFSSDKNFDDIEIITGDTNENFFDLIERNKILSSKSELRRLFEQGGVKMIEPEEKRVKEEDKIYEGILRIGKKNFFEIKIK